MHFDFDHICLPLYFKKLSSDRLRELAQSDHKDARYWAQDELNKRVRVAKAAFQMENERWFRS